jgi:hypothetical protein
MLACACDCQTIHWQQPGTELGVTHRAEPRLICKLHHVILSSCAFRPRQQLNDRLDQDSSIDTITITINSTQREKSEW